MLILYLGEYSREILLIHYFYDIIISSQTQLQVQFYWWTGWKYK